MLKIYYSGAVLSRKVLTVGAALFLILIQIKAATAQNPFSLTTPNPFRLNTPTSTTPTSTTPTSTTPTSTTPPAPVPESLNPNPNPLLFPTQPEEVRVDVVQPLTLRQALDLAQRNNRDLQNSLLTLERSRAGLREALAANLPTAGLQADLTRSESANAALANLATPGGADRGTLTTSVNGSVQVNYDLFTAGRRPALIRAAEEQVRFEELEVERRAEQVRLDVANTYYDLQAADAQVEIAEAAIRDATRSLRDAQLLEQAGLGTQFDILRAQVQLAEANQELTRVRSLQSINRRRLVQLLNLSQTVDVRAADPIAAAGTWNLSLEDSIVRAFGNRAELQQQLARRNISQQQQQVALAAERPQVNLFANLNALNVFNDNLGTATGLTMGARVRWDFFSGGAVRARAAQEQTNQAIAENQFADVRNQIRLQVEQAFFNLNSNRQNIQTASVALEQAERSLELARLRFNSGVGTQTEVINAQTELTRARVNQLRAIVDYNRELSNLQRAVSNAPGTNLGLNP